MATHTIARHASVSSPHRGRRERRKADIRHRLFRAALELFGTRGFAATTVEDITQAADVAKGTFFNYFPTKEHLLIEFGELRLDLLRHARDQALGGQEELRVILHRLLHTLAEEPGESRALARSMMLGGLRGEPCSTILRKKLAAGRQILGDAIEAGQRRREIRAGITPEDVARLYQQLFFGGLHLWTLDAHLDLERYLDTTFAFFWAAVGSSKQPSRKRSS